MNAFWIALYSIVALQILGWVIWKMLESPAKDFVKALVEFFFLEKPLRGLLILLLAYSAVVSNIQMFRCDALTRTQLLKELPRNLILKFKDC